MISLICGTYKTIQMKLITKQKYTHRHRKQTYAYERGKEGGINEVFGNKRYTLLYIKQTRKKNEDLLYSKGTIFNIL